MSAELRVAVLVAIAVSVSTPWWQSLLLAAHDARERRKADLRALTAEITGRPL